MATARDDPRWNNFSPSEITTYALRDAQMHPKDWTDSLNKGWGGVKSKKSDKARAMAPVLQKMLLKDGKGNLPDGCIDFQLGMKESQGIQKECRVLETRRRLEERASQKLTEQKKDLIEILDSCSTNVLKIDEFQKQYKKNLLQSTSSRARLMKTVEWLDEIMTVQAQYLMSKYIGIEIPSVDARMDSIFNPDIPVLNTAANVSYAARRAGISTRGSFLTVSDYIKQYTKEKDKLSINEYPLIEASLISTGGFKTRQMHKSIKAPRKYENPHHCLWSQVKTAALIPFFPDSIRKIICVVEIDSDGNKSTWWKRFRKFWYHQDSLAMQDRDHDTANMFMDEWNQFDINYILNMENALSDSPGKRPWSNDESGEDQQQQQQQQVNLDEEMTDLFDNAYGNVVIEELSMAEMDKITKQVTAQLNSRCEQQGIGCLDNPSKTFVREFLGMSKLSHENNLSVVPKFNNLPPLLVLMAEAVPVHHHHADDDGGGGDLEDSPPEKNSFEALNQSATVAAAAAAVNSDISNNNSSGSSGEEDKEFVVESILRPDVIMTENAAEHTSLPKLTQTHLVMNDNGSLNTSSKETADKTPAAVKGDSLEVSLQTLVGKTIIEAGDAVAVRMFLKQAEIMLELKTKKGAELSYKRLRWALSRCWALINFLCSVTNSIYQNSKQEGKGTEIITRYEAVRNVLNRHFSSPDLRAILSSAGTGKEDEVIYGNTIHEASWPADFPLMNLKQAKNLGPCSSSISFGSINTALETRTAASVSAIEVEASWDYTVGGWLCIRCMKKLKERWGDCRCQCFRGHKRRQCMGPMSHCYGFHPNRLMEYLALGLQTRYNDGRGPGDAYFNRTWAGRQRWRRWRMCIKDIVLNGDSWFGVVPKNQQRLGFSGLSTNLKELTRDWLERVDWSHYNLWNKKKTRYKLFALTVARLDMLVRCGSWLVVATEQKMTRVQPPKKKKRSGNRKKAVWSSVSGRCAMCGQDLIVNKNNTSRGLCVGCRSWGPGTNAETQLISNIPEYRFFNAKVSSIDDMDNDCIKQRFDAGNQFVHARPILCAESAARGIAVPVFSPNGILAHVKNRMRNLLYPDQEGLDEEDEEVQLGHWHEGIYYPHPTEKENALLSMDSKQQQQQQQQQHITIRKDSLVLPSQADQEIMLHGVWEEVRIEICCWSKDSFKDLLKESSWDSESIALANEWRRVWHNVIKCFQNKTEVQAFRKIMIDFFSLPNSTQTEASLLSALPANVVPKKLTIFGTIKPMSKMSQCKEMMDMKRQDQIYAASKNCLSRLMRWWPRPVVEMVNRWMRWKDDLILFKKVRRNFAKKTIVPKKKKIKLKAVSIAPPPPRKEIKKPLPPVIVPPPPLVSSIITVTETETPRLSFSARWCLKLPEKQTRKRKRQRQRKK